MRIRSVRFVMFNAIINVWTIVDLITKCLGLSSSEGTFKNYLYQKCPFEWISATLCEKAIFVSSRHCLHRLNSIISYWATQLHSIVLLEILQLKSWKKHSQKCVYFIFIFFGHSKFSSDETPKIWLTFYFCHITNFFQCNVCLEIQPIYSLLMKYIVFCQQRSI